GMAEGTPLHALYPAVVRLQPDTYFIHIPIGIRDDIAQHGREIPPMRQDERACIQKRFACRPQLCPQAAVIVEILGIHLLPPRSHPACEPAEVVSLRYEHQADAAASETAVTKHVPPQRLQFGIRFVADEHGRRTAASPDEGRYFPEKRTEIPARIVAAGGYRRIVTTAGH